MEEKQFKKKKSLFFSAEGLDGAGKSEQIKIIVEELEKAGYEVVQTREPGGTPVAEQLRDIIKYPIEDLSLEAELLMFYASRAQNVKHVIKPALSEGKMVVADRFDDSTDAYQSARGIPRDKIKAISEVVLNGFKPDFTFYYDINLITSKARMRSRGEKIDNLEKDADATFNTIRANYKKIAKEDPDRFIVISGMDSLEEVSMATRYKMKEILLNLEKKNQKKLKI